MEKDKAESRTDVLVNLSELIQRMKTGGAIIYARELETLIPKLAARPSVPEQAQGKPIDLVSSFYKFMAAIGFKSQYMTQEDFYMSWPEDAREREKFGTLCLSQRAAEAIGLAASRSEAQPPDKVNFSEGLTVAIENLIDQFESSDHAYEPCQDFENCSICCARLAIEKAGAPAAGSAGLERQIRVCERAFQLQEGFGVEGREGKYNALQISRAWLDLEQREEKACEFRDKFIKKVQQLGADHNSEYCDCPFCYLRSWMYQLLTINLQQAKKESGNESTGNSVL